MLATLRLGDGRLDCIARTGSGSDMRMRVEERRQRRLARREKVWCSGDEAGISLPRRVFRFVAHVVPS